MSLKQNSKWDAFLLAKPRPLILGLYIFPFLMFFWELLVLKRLPLSFLVIEMTCLEFLAFCVHLLLVKKRLLSIVMLVIAILLFSGVRFIHGISVFSQLLFWLMIAFLIFSLSALVYRKYISRHSKN